MSVAVFEAYDSNVEFQNQNGAGDLGSSVNVHVGGDWNFPRADVKLSGDANQIFYRQATDLNHFTYGFGSSASYQISRRLRWSASESISSGYAQDQRVLTDAGLLFPKVLTRVVTASTQFGYDITRKTHVDVAVSGQSVSFGGPDLVGGSSLGVHLNVTRQIGRSQTVGISTGDTKSNGITGDIQGLLGTWSATIGRALTLAATAGVRPYTLPGQSGFLVAPGGSFNVNAHLPRGNTFGLTYERAVEQAYGFSGTHLAHRFGASYGLAATPGLHFDASANYGLNTYPLDPSFRLDGRTGNVGVKYAVRQNLAVSADYTAWARRSASEPPVTTYRVTSSLAYGFSWR